MYIVLEILFAFVFYEEHTRERNGGAREWENKALIWWMKFVTKRPKLYGIKKNFNFAFFHPSFLSILSFSTKIKNKIIKIHCFFAHISFFWYPSTEKSVSFTYKKKERVQCVVEQLTWCARSASALRDSASRSCKLNESNMASDVFHSASLDIICKFRNWQKWESKKEELKKKNFFWCLMMMLSYYFKTCRITDINDSIRH